MLSFVNANAIWQYLGCGHADRSENWLISKNVFFDRTTALFPAPRFLSRERKGTCETGRQQRQDTAQLACSRMQQRSQAPPSATSQSAYRATPLQKEKRSQISASAPNTFLPDLAHKDVLYNTDRVLRAACFSLFHPTLLEGVRARAVAVRLAREP